MGLAGAGPGDADDILPLDGIRNDPLLNRCRFLKSIGSDEGHGFPAKIEITELFHAVHLY